MPRNETQTVKVQDVRKDDILSWNGTEHVITTRPVTKTKFVYLDTSTIGAAVLRIEHGTEVPVTRSVPTADEKIAQARQLVLETADHERASALRRLTEARAKLVETFAKNEDASSFNIDVLISAQARVKVTFHLPTLDDADHTEDEKIKHARAIVDEAKRRLIENGRVGRSTSPISNEMDHAEREALSNLAGGFSSVGAALNYLDQLEAAANA